MATQTAVTTSGSALLVSLRTIGLAQAWLAPLKFSGLATLLSGITLALATIIHVLRFQIMRIVALVR